MSNEHPIAAVDYEAFHREVDDFARLVEQKITDRTKYLWFPEIIIERYADKAYMADEAKDG